MELTLTEITELIVMYKSGSPIEASWNKRVLLCKLEQYREMKLGRNLHKCHACAYVGKLYQ